MQRLETNLLTNSCADFGLDGFVGTALKTAKASLRPEDAQ